MGWRGPSDEGQSHSIKDGSRDEREMLLSVVCATVEIQATMPPFFSAARLTSACFSVKERLGHLPAHHVGDRKSRGDKRASITSDSPTISSSHVLPGFDICIRNATDIVPVQRSHTRPTAYPMNLSDRVEKERLPLSVRTVDRR